MVAFNGVAFNGVAFNGVAFIGVALDGVIPRHKRAAAFAVLAMALVPLSSAAELSLADVERLALANDPAVRSVEAQQLALTELSVAAQQLPDPMLKVGLMSLPVDSFELGQEPMTQAQIGLVQTFPRGRTRALRSEQITQKSDMLDQTARDQELQILLAVREQYLEVIKQTHRAGINADAIRVFTDFADITRDYYATGRVHQQDVLQAVVELAKAEERAQQIAEEEERARARLATWIGDASRQAFDTHWPQLDAPLARDALHEQIKRHPRILALQQKIEASETGVELARQQYKPEFSVDVTYGGRGGTEPDGSSRADMLSMMVVMDLPLFHRNRQDRVTASMIAESSAAMFDRDDIYRRMQSEADLNTVTLERQRERLELFAGKILPEARFSAESSFAAYQSAVGDLTTLLRAQITEFELQLEHAHLQAETLKTQARLLYLQGERP
jgi:outer membrane protein TolC